MPLYIRDDKVDDLAEQVMRATGARTKTEAVREALVARLKAEEQRKPLIDKIREAQAIAAKIGPVNPDFDMKAFTDEI